MSRIGKRPVQLPKNVKAKIEGGSILLEGPKGKLSFTIPARVKVELKDEAVSVSRSSDDKADRAMHGMVRSTIQNMARGVSEGFTKELAIEGVGFRAQLKGKELSLALGFSHTIEFPIPAGIEIKTPKPNQIVINGSDKALVGQVAADIRHYFEPEPYKGKGIRYVGEYVRRKQGKTVG